MNYSNEKTIPSTTKKSTPFISMNLSNLSKYDILPVDDYIFIFDIDDTLYKASDDMVSVEIEKWRKAYNHYLNDKKKEDKHAVPPFSDIIKCNPLLSESFYKCFGKHPYEVELCRGILDYSLYVKKNDKLINLLRDLPYRKYCFTNGMKCRAEPILDVMGLTDVFEGVICMDDRSVDNFVLGKPKEEAYDFVEKLLNIKDRSKVYFFDDACINIEEGLRRGWNSYLVKKEDDIVEMVSRILVEISSDMDR
ncbi:hypothetical protein P3W45_001050 [Vairimorpha bombi]|jgi:pyrimidine and pyridine-specific 5'-nucleotidase